MKNKKKNAKDGKAIFCKFISQIASLELISDVWVKYDCGRINWVGKILLYSIDFYGLL